MLKKIKEEHYLNELFDFLGISAKKFAESIGLGRAERVYRVLKGLNNISPDLASIIIKKYPNVDYKWLLTGKGSMLKNINISQQTIEGHNETVNAVGQNIGGTINQTNSNLQKQKEKIELLKGLKELLDSGILTEAEFKAEKKKILESN